MNDKYPSITVKWADHWIDNGDHTANDVETKAKPYYGEYTGFLVHETKQVIVVCSNIWENGDVSDDMYIMKKCITSRSDKE